MFGKNWSRLAAMILILIVFVSVPMTCFASGAETDGNDGTVESSNEETEKKHVPDDSKRMVKRTVRVGCAVSTGYHQKNDDGSISGYGYSYEKLLAQYGEWNIEYVEGDWNDLQDMLADGQIDLLGFLVETPERKEKYEFSQLSAGNSMSCLTTRKNDDRFSYQDYPSFIGMTVGCITSNANVNSFQDYAAENGFTANIKYFQTYSEIFDAIDDGTVDAGLMTNYQELSGYSIIDQLLSVNYHYAVRKGNTELLKELNEAMSDVDSYYANIEQTLYAQYYDSRNAMNAAFTQEELNYLATNPVVKVVPCGRNVPFEGFDSSTGKYYGIVPEVLDKIADLTGIEFKYVNTNDRWIFKHENIGKNVITCFSCDMEWANLKNMYVTQPFMESTISVVYKKMAKKDVTVALVEGIYLDYLAVREHPEWNIRYYDTREDCLEAVRGGEVSCTLLNSYESDYYLSMGKYRSLKDESVSGLIHNVGLGLTYSSDTQLLQVISKAMMMIPTSEYEEIIRVNTNSAGTSNLQDLIYSNPVQVICFSVLIVFLIMFSIYMMIYTRSIRRKNQEITEANLAKTDFLSRVSHDLRTPMNAIINLTNIVEEEIDNRDAALEDIGKIKTSNQFLLSLINDVLDVSKMENRQMELHPERYTYREFLNYIHSTFEPLCKEKEIQFTVQRDSHDAEIIIDKVRFNQLCFNLLSNAVKYTPKGGHVTLRMEHGEDIDGKFTCDIYVIDDGIGMSREFQEKMCEPFSQEGRAFKSVEGTGLGLYIVKAIIDLFGGTFDVESQEGKGTVIHVHMIMEHAAAEIQNHESDTIMLDESSTNGSNISSQNSATGKPDQNSQDADILKGKHILVVEDHTINQEIARRLLEKAGITTELANDGAEGVEIFKNAAESFDAILMDIRMPVMDGLQAAEAIRAMDMEKARTIPIIAMTANAYDEDVRKTKEAGMNAHIAKPVNAQLLYETIAENLKDN